MARGEVWSDQEIRTALDSYFSMMLLEIHGVRYKKSDVSAAAAGLLPGRSRKSIEFKWCNISAILEGHGLRRIEGFKPLRNYQQRLKELTALWLMQHPYLSSMLAQDGAK